MPEDSLYLKYAEYWKEPGPTTLPRVVELANWLHNEKKFGTNVGYGDTVIKQFCNEFDSTPGAPQALIEAGYLIAMESWGHTWWQWQYPPTFGGLK